MNHKILYVIGAGLVLLSAGACRKQSDPLTAYDQDENLVFAAADTSFAAKFDVIWNGMNQYYAIWDYEKELGVDWDAVYEAFRPQFEALDQRKDVSDEELTALLQKSMGQLHDGHLYFQVLNHKTGNRVMCFPGMDRIKKRDDYAASTCTPSLAYYANMANGEVETDETGQPRVMVYSTLIAGILTEFAQTPGKGLLYVKEKVNDLSARASTLTEIEAFVLQQYLAFYGKFMDVITQDVSFGFFIGVFNRLVDEYAFLQIPGLDYIDPVFADKGLQIQAALLKGNIAYLQFGSFALSCYLDDEKCRSTFDMSLYSTQERVGRVRQVWQMWFDAIQQLHRSGTLGGVIIDLRGNGGGSMFDSPYVVGALVPSGGLEFGYQRFKRGSGRYDYSPLTPAVVKTMDLPHETVTEPIVILTNCQSVSMSESSVLCAKTLPNGTHIGKRTWGALCALTSNDNHSYNYAGLIGVQGVTSVFGHVPSMASFTKEKEMMESVGLTPDIEVDLDISLFQTTGRDTQLDRALQFIRTGK